MALPVLVDSESAMKEMAAVQPMLRQSSRSREDRTASRIRAGDLRYLAAPLTLLRSVGVVVVVGGEQRLQNNAKTCPTDREWLGDSTFQRNRYGR
jgi:hypothetical protein